MKYRALLPLLLFALPASAQEQQAQPPQPQPLRPAPSTLPKVSLEEAVRRATTRNPNAEIAAQEIRRAEALTQQVRATWLPILNLNGTYTRLDDDRELNGRVILAKNQLAANAQLSVPIIAPRQWVAYARAKDNIGVAQSDAVGARREVAIATARAYLTIIAQRRVLAATYRALNHAKLHETYSTTRFEGGVGNKLDAVRASQERAAALTRVRNQEAALARACEALGVVLGEEGPIDTSEEPSLGAPSMESALADVSTKRADVVAERDRLNVAHRTARDSWVDYLPVMTGVVQPFYQNPPTFTQPQTGWQAQLLLQIPLFDGGNRYGLAHEREALEAQAKSRLEGILRQARSEVRVAFETMKRADEALISARDAMNLARESLDLAETAYRAGATSNIEVVDAERRAHEAETQAAFAEDASRQARLDLLAASGRFPN